VEHQWYFINVFLMKIKKDIDLKPNKDTLYQLDIPIHIFHGKYDQNVSVKGVYDIKETFDNLCKNNLSIHVFDEHDHDLNYLNYPINGIISEGISEILKVAESL
jgi:hypothetical protein